jgi:Uncharacterized protein conserved in bacteria
MHCPRCGQQQVSGETRFCSRCGFPLGLVSELLAHGGFLPQLAELYSNKNKKFLTRKNGVKIGLAWFLLLTFLLTPLAALAGLEEGTATLAVLGFMGGLLMMLFSVIFLEGEKKSLPLESNYQAANFMGGQVNQHTLPPQQSQPVQDFVPPADSWKAPNTGEYAKPPSVTEETTKLLHRDD